MGYYTPACPQSLSPNYRGLDWLGNGENCQLRECRAAATALGIPAVGYPATNVKVTSRPDLPTGCIQRSTHLDAHDAQGRLISVFLNTHDVGADNPDYSPICKFNLNLGYSVCGDESPAGIRRHPRRCSNDGSF